MSVDRAVSAIVSALKDGRCKNYGYELYISSVIEHEHMPLNAHDPSLRDKILGDHFDVYSDAAWILVQRGILRPGIKTPLRQCTPEGGFCLTVFGRSRLVGLDASDHLVLAPDSLTKTFQKFSSKYGDAFLQRAADAVVCRSSGAHLASCAMAGAAAEAVLLSIAIAKVGDERQVTKTYLGSRGRSGVLKLIAGQSKKHIAERLNTFSGIIAVWRDEAAHGSATEIAVENADEALRTLLHMCQWVDKEWESLTS